MSMLRRRMMMKAKEQQSSGEELDYLTIIPLHDEEEVYYIYPYRGSHDSETLIEIQELAFHYRINNGEWIEVMLPNSYDLKFEINLSKDTVLQLKCMGCDFSWNYFIASVFNIRSSGLHNVSGTPMSLLYGDDFKNYNTTCYDNGAYLFNGDIGLVRILNPKTFLPYELSAYCYDSMFGGCENLTHAPELPSSSLVDGCYSGMFAGCYNLKYIKMLATDISADDCLTGWVNGVASTGTFVKHPDMNSLPTATKDNYYAGIPEGWTVVNDGEESGRWKYDRHFKFEIEDNGFAGSEYVETGDFSELYLFTINMIKTIGEKTEEGWAATHYLYNIPSDFNVTFNGERTLKLHIWEYGSVGFDTESYTIDLYESLLVAMQLRS